MYMQQDWLMRQIEMILSFITQLLFEKRIQDAGGEEILRQEAAAELAQELSGLLREKRLGRAAELLAGTALPVEDIIGAVGYDNTSYFYRKFREHYGVSPKQYREGKRF